MSISKLAHSIVTIRQRVHKRWLLIMLLGVMLAVAAYLAYRSSPISQLAEARARWAANGYLDYRIVVQYQVPLYSCQQDLEVRNGALDYRNQDSCSMTPIMGSNQGIMEMLTVAELFARAERAISAPECGPNGCICDGPIIVDVVYDSALGYPQRLDYRVSPENRWRYLEFWLSQFSGAPPCRPVTYVGQSITVVTLKPLKPPVNLGGLVDDLTPEATTEDAGTPEAKPTFPLTIR